MLEQLKATPIRRVSPGDGATLRRMQESSFRTLGAGFYTSEQIEAFLTHIGTMDDFLFHEGTYHVLTHGEAIVASGGWSRRTPRYAAVAGEAEAGSGAAAPKIRSVYVHPAYARRGLASRLVRHAEAEAIRAGHGEIELTATLSGVPLYIALGYETTGSIALDLGGVTIRGIAMRKRLAAPEGGGPA